MKQPGQRMMVLAEEVPGILKSVIPYLGVPGAMMAVLVWALVKGWIITGREAADAKEQHEGDMAEWAARYAKLEQEKDEWKREALASMRALEIAGKTVEKSVNVLERKCP